MESQWDTDTTREIIREWDALQDRSVVGVEGCGRKVMSTRASRNVAFTPKPQDINIDACTEVFQSVGYD